MSIAGIVTQLQSPKDIIFRGMDSGTIAVLTNYHLLTGRQMITTLADNKLPLEIAVDSSGGISGLTVTASIRDPATSNSYLDFGDNTFKNSGWVSKSMSISEIGGGFYSSVLDVSAITNFPTANHAIVEYSVSGSVTAIGTSFITIAQTWENIKALTFAKWFGLK